MVDPRAIKFALRTLLGELREGLASNPSTHNLLRARRRSRGINDDHTGGYWAEVGRLSRAISVELWVDHYSGLPTPRAWVGFSSASFKDLSLLAQQAKRLGFRRYPTIKTSRDVTPAPPYYRFSHALRSSEMDVLVLEKYKYRHFLGVFLSYDWPFSRRIRRLIVRNAVNLIGTFNADFAPPGYSGHPRSPGLWARPDPATEAAAVRFVRHRLHMSGYAVKSRESEICGYDLHATKHGAELHVEVKGSKGDTPHFFISRNEYTVASRDPEWRLAVVLVGGIKPKFCGFNTAATMRRIYHLAPTQWEGRLSRITRKL